MDDRFYNAFLAPEVVVCGRRLRKFTVWHFFLLSAVGSPFVNSEDIRPEHLLAAIEICRNEHGSTKSLHPRFRDFWWRRKLIRNPEIFREQAKIFHEWMRLHSQRPIYWRKSEGGYSSGPTGPRCLFLIGSLMRRGGLSQSEAWNTSLGEAQWIDICFSQIDGAPLHIVDEEMMSDEEIDLSRLTDDQALEMFTRDLPAELVQSSFEHWKTNVKRKGGHA